MTHDAAAEPAPRSQAEADMRRLAKFGRLAGLAAFAVIIAALLGALDLLALLDPWIRGVTTADGALLGTTAIAALHKIAPLIPVGFYLTAVLGAVGILHHISEGEYFSARNIRALADMGGAMLWGAGWTLFLVQGILDWTSGAGGYRVDFRPEPLVIGTIGLCLLVLGRLLLRAQKLESEMEAIV